MPQPSKFNDLSDEQKRILLESGTEFPFSGAFNSKKDSGTYVCAQCGNELFSSETKYDSKTGWPSFYDVIAQGKVELKPESSWGQEYFEAVCANCKGHLGHMFGDGPSDKTGQRYCINSAALNFKPEDGSEVQRGDKS